MDSLNGVLNNAVSGRISKAENAIKNMKTDNRFDQYLVSDPKHSVINASGSKTKIDEKLMQTCFEIESLLVAKMLKQMRNNISKSGWINGGHAEEIFEDMLYDEYALNMSKNHNFGYARMLYDEMSRKVNY